ncbi:MAG: 1-(5-phosphoribosyl)-5-[(5-phosphoribosylamino)methylideneamino]imidazole-4-carboxamide isomerase [Chloroflexi bacterium]|nr:1-(5-phosphoribosyl)-5-[(5-phosphoribosylamino)methylideneamino]imidazole-4-carboxamide isomerase [Chloroflexota bacterium]
MIIYPAVDIRGGRAVRLHQGDFAREVVFYDSPAEAARNWIDQGAEWLHVVDLDGARSGTPTNRAAVAAIAELPAQLQLGGGLRRIEAVESAIAGGADRVVLGTAAVEDPALFQAACRQFPGQIAVGIDARDGVAATRGWARDAGTDAVDLACACERQGAAAIIYTDIDRDGMLGGINTDRLAQVCGAVEIPVIASGGVAALSDVTAASAAGAAGLIIGRALYDGRVDLRAALTKAAGAAEC